MVQETHNEGDFSNARTIVSDVLNIQLFIDPNIANLQIGGEDDVLETIGTIESGGEDVVLDAYPNINSGN